jgi:DNA-directed RNA polymerase II subunit RPB1
VSNGKIVDIHDVDNILRKMDPELKQMLKLHEPENMLLSVIPVPPPTVRPPIMSGNRIRGEDDLTYRLLQILRVNKKFKGYIESKRPAHIISNMREQVQNAITGYINHTKLGACRSKSSKKEYTSLGARLTSKEGRMRGNLMGKRVDYSARSVITGDDNLSMNEVGVPLSIADKLTIPIKVTSYNRGNLQTMLDNDNTVKFVIKPNGSRIDLSFVKKNISLEVGYTVERKLQDGDVVLFNRQPSLHKGSIMAHFVKVLPYSTFRLNLSCTPPYNADFDGDEMNLHCLQTNEARAEAKYLMLVQNNIITPQNNRPVMSIIQDSLIGVYLMTADGVTIDRGDMMNCVMTIPGWDGKMEYKDVYTGKDLVSLTLPYVNYKKHGVEIVRGKLLKGQLSKKTLGSSHGSLIHVIHNDCGPKKTVDFIHRLQLIAHRWLSINGFSIGISDMISSKDIRREVKNEKKMAFEEVQDETDEAKINQRLNICRDKMGSMVQAPLDDSNRLYSTVNAGSKGNNLNISQILAVVGQQNLSGSRIPYSWNKRTLPHFRRNSNGPRERGFIEHSYVEGLSPHEVFFHAISGREGLIDTACKTSTTGYLQRRFMKALENIRSYWDGSVRNADGSILQFQYGDDAIDPIKVEKQIIDTFEFPEIEEYGGIEEEYTQILEDHSFLQEIDSHKDPQFKGTKYYMLPVPVRRIVDNAKKLFGFPSRLCKQDEIYKKIKKLNEKIDNKMIKILIRSELNSKKLIKLSLNADELGIITQGVLDAYEIAKVQTGESVGAVAAQSLGEPATQMTLNTFHFAGISSKNVTLGIPRLEECINVAKKIKTPISNIKSDNLEDVLKKLKHITISDILITFKITDTPDDSEVEDFFLFPDDEYITCQTKSKTLVLYLKDWMDVTTIKDVIYSYDGFYCSYSDGPDAIFHINSINVDEKMDMFFEKNLKNCSIAGIPGAEYANIVSMPGKPPMIETSLTNLSILFEIVGIEYNKLYTNDVYKIYETLGIEAARAAYLIEIRNILAFYGIYVNIRHVMVVVDWMTFIGIPTPLTRHGIRNIDQSPLKRSTFEEVVEVFNQAACYSETDSLQGVSECIIAGVPPKIGTNVCSVIKDTVVEREHRVEPPKVAHTDSWENTVWIEEDNPWRDDEEMQATSNPPMLLPPANFTPGFPGAPVPGFPGAPVPGFPGAPVPGFPGAPVPGFPGASGQMFNPCAPLIPGGFNSFGGFSTGFGSNVPSSDVQMYTPSNPRPSSPIYNPQKPNEWMQPPDSPEWKPKSPEYDPNSPEWNPKSPSYNPNSPTSPMDSPVSPAYSPTSPMGSPMSPAYSPTSPMGSPVSPAYSPTSPMGSPMSPAYSPTSPAYSPTSPRVDDFDSFSLGEPALQDHSAPSYDSSIFLPNSKRSKKEF